MSLRHANLLAVFVLASCASAVHLPPDAQQPIICVYNFLKSASGIEEPKVFLVQNRHIIIAYGFKNKTGQVETHEISMARGPLNERFSAATDYPADPALADIIFGKLRAQCDVEAGYEDQVIVTKPASTPYRWRVDMSKVSN